ncbi:MAG TPA: hypothetical protein VN577_10325 [Terriglobales bacterium]|nr:hypothetical protein [Terriglobales bacterium]
MLRPLCVTRQRQWTGTLTEILPELALAPQVITDVESMPPQQNWAVAILDMDTLRPDLTQSRAQLALVCTHARHVIALLPLRLSFLLRDLEQCNATVLHKPVTAGEIALALKRALRQS